MPGNCNSFSLKNEMHSRPLRTFSHKASTSFALGKRPAIPMMAMPSGCEAELLMRTDQRRVAHAGCRVVQLEFWLPFAGFGQNRFLTGPRAAVARDRSLL